MEHTNQVTPELAPVEQLKETQHDLEMETSSIEPKTGVVANCLNLNVRAEADSTSEVLCTIACTTQVLVNLWESTKDFYNVRLASGATGFCAKQFIEVWA